jgi:hypothetical protein
MNIQVYTAPTLAVLTRSELELHLRLDSVSFDDSLTTTQSLAYGSHAIANNYTTHAGTGINVAGKLVEVIVHAGTNGDGGTNDTKIQESDTDVSANYTDWTGGAFDQITTANDNQDHKKQYTGSKTYIRTVSKVLVAACEFGTSVVSQSPESIDDDNLDDAIGDGTELVQNIARRQLLTATHDYYLQAFPGVDFIKLPYGNLQNGAGTAPVITYTDSDGTVTTMTVTTDYLVETNGEGIGRIVLPYEGTWPTATLYPSNPIKIRYTCGWTAAASIPKPLKRAVKLAAEDSYYHFDRHDILKEAIQNLCASYRLWDEFE